LADTDPAADDGAPAPHHPSLNLNVVEAQREDIGRGIVRLDPDALAQLGAAAGGVLEIAGRKRTYAKAMPTLREERGKDAIELDGVTRLNAGVWLDQTVAVKKAVCGIARRVTIAPLGGAPLGEDDIDYLASRLDGLAVNAGDRLRIARLGGGHSDFAILRTEPEGAVLLHAETLLAIDDAPPEADGSAEITTYDDLGGLAREVERIREMVELPLVHPEIFERLGIAPPKGVLLYGPPGCGKTLLARAVAHEADAYFIYVSGPEIMHEHYGASEERLRKIFEDAKRLAPCIIFFDEIDAVAPRRDRVEGEVERRVVAQLLALMDGLESRGDVVVMAATNRPDSLDPALRRPGRFDREITIPVPSAQARREILAIHSRGMPLAADVDRDKLAEAAHGFTGADLAALCREAAMASLRRHLPRLLPSTGRLSYEVLAEIEVTMADFREALTEITPSALREFAIDVPQIGWDAVVGLDEVKQALEEAIAWPLREPALFARLRLDRPHGILLYGPPGNGKTLIVRALASRSHLNFIPVKGPQLLSKYVGESERAVRELFARARQAAPCIVFLDEVDALAPRRGGERSEAADRVVSQLLCELDGIEALRGVHVIAATNRPDMVDAALLRPGRIDYRLEVPKPDRQRREAILVLHLRDRPLAPGLDVARLAGETEGMSAAEVRFVCDRAALVALRRVLPDAGPSDAAALEITAADFAAALAALG
jgi:transitional endoplasmic reticulum ATPase